MTVAVIAACPFPYPRGTPIRIQRMAEHLARQGHEVHVVTYHLGQGDPAPEIHMHRTRSIPGYRNFAPGPTAGKLLLLDPLLTFQLVGLLRRQRVDVLYAHHYEGLLAALAARRLTRSRGESPMPVVYDAHTLLRSELPYYHLWMHRTMARAIGARLDRAIPPRADHVISVSDTIRNHLVAESGMAPDTITVIPNGVELEMFEIHSANGGAGPGGIHRLVFAGNLAPYQGIDLLLQAFRHVRERRRDVHLVLATDSPFDAYETMARDLGIRDGIELVPGNVEQLPAEFERATVALNPRPDCDGIPMKLLNYMASSMPVVSFARSAPGVVHGDTGWLIEGTDPRAFAEGILHLLKTPDEARVIGRNARRHVEIHHGWDTAAARAASIFQELVQKAPRRKPPPAGSGHER